jgi:hypothetical protein
MYKLKLLIVCLLANYNLFSQNDTISKVILNEKTAREVIKDLIRLDSCVKTTEELLKIISNKEKEIESWEEIVFSEQALSSEKTDLIIKQYDKINNLTKPKVHLYIGIRNDNLQFNQTTIFSNFLYCTKKIDFGIHANLNAVTKPTYGVTAQYKIF